MRYKILQVVLDMQYVGEKIVAALARRISKDFDVSFCCLDTIGLLGEDMIEEGFRITALNRGPGFDYKIPSKIAQIVREQNIDIIHAHHYTSYFYSALSRFVCRRPRLIFTEHGRNFPDIVGIRRKIANLVLNTVTDRIVSVCEFTKQGIIENEKLPAAKNTVIYNGIEPIDTQSLVPDPSNREVIEWIGTSDKVLGFMGRLEEIKNPVLLLNGFAKALGKVPDAKLVVMGKGVMMPSLKEQVRSLGIEQSVLIAGLVKNPLPVVPKFRALVVTSLCEAASLSMLEAMMCGVPVIASDVGGNPELVRHNVTGCLVPSGDANGFAGAMISLLTNNALAEKLGQAAKADTLLRFSIDPMVEAYMKVYHELLSPE